MTENHANQNFSTRSIAPARPERRRSEAEALSLPKGRAAETTTPVQPISNRNSKLLEILLTHAESIISIFLIDNFQRLHPEVVDPERSRSGSERIITNACSQNYKFEGKERDTESGNDDFGARYYSSRLGRWLSADWSSVPVPVPYANLSNPQTLNLYAMVNDNPETFADLDGHQCLSTLIFGPNGPTCAGGDTQPPAGTKPGDGFAEKQKSDTQKAEGADAQRQKDDQQYHQLLQQKEEKIREQQAGPAVGSPEYTKQLTDQVAALTTSGEKQILAPAAILEGAGVAVGVATSGTAVALVNGVAGDVSATAATAAGAARVAVAAGASAATTAEVAAITHPRTVQFVTGAFSGAMHGPMPPTAAGRVGFLAGKVIGRILHL